MSTDNATKPATREPEERGVLVNDPEIKALALVDKVLAGLDPDQAMRVVRYHQEKYVEGYWRKAHQAEQERAKDLAAKEQG